MNYFILMVCGFVLASSQHTCEGTENNTNYCQNGEDSKGNYTECSGLNPRLDLLPQSTTRLVIIGGNYTSSSLLSYLKNPNLSSLRFRRTELYEFNWDLLTVTCERLYISDSNVPTRFYSPHVGACEQQSTLNVTRLYLTKIDYQHIPKCLPNSLTLLSLVNIPLLAFEGGNITDDYSMNPNTLTWPPKLEYLYITNPQFTNIDDHVFEKIPHTLGIIIIRNCRNPVAKYPRKWASGNNITHLEISNCQLHEITENDMLNLTNLKTLQLRNNQIDNIPNNLATSLETIDLTSNNIATIAAQAVTRLVNLKKLYLRRNRLTSVPGGLPTEIEIIDLSENMLEFLDNIAFSHLSALTSLDVSDNRIINMPRNLPFTMRKLDLNHNEISLVRSEEEYYYCVNCTVLNLSNNPWVCDNELITMLVWFKQRPSESVNPIQITVGGVCNSLKDDIGSINIADLLSYIQYIRTEFPSCNYDVQSLICNSSEKQLTQFPKMPPNGLVKVDIAENPNLTRIPDNLFQSQTRLETLDLGANGLTNFPVGLPSSLKVLSLIGNQISYLPEDPEVFGNLQNLEILVLSDNNLTTVYDFQFNTMTSLTQLYLSNNPWHCDCSLQSFVEWLVSNDKLETRGNILARPHCTSPVIEDGTLLSQLTGAFIYLYKCAPDKCIWSIGTQTLNCSLAIQQELEMLIPYGDNFTTQSIPTNKYWRTLDLSNVGLRSDEIHLQQLSELINLDLSGNLLVSIPVNELPSSLRNINLSGNNIATLPNIQQISETLSDLETLDLSNNQISAVPSNRIGIFHAINSVYLDGNTLDCSCSIKPLQGYIQSNKDDLLVTATHRLNNLRCHSPPDLAGKSIVNVTEEMYCPGVNVGMIVGVVTSVVIIVIVIAIVINVVYHRRRKIQERKDIVQGFKELLEQEALRNDQPDAETGVREAVEYKYDAFVSYRGEKNDEDFVYKLLEELEDNRHRKICLHERDFIPGRSIAENIVECIGSSRRVILVISRKYAASGWCQYEVQVALAHLHQSRQSRLLVPVLLEDITNKKVTMGSVQTILSLISGIQTPSYSASSTRWRAFWNKLNDAIAENIVNHTTDTTRL